MIPAGTLLPPKKTAILENLEANIHRGDFTVQYRHTPRDVPIYIISSRSPPPTFTNER